MKVSPADHLITSIQNIFSKSYSRGLVLLTMVIVGLAWANSSFHESYEHFFHHPFIIGFEGFSIIEPVHIWVNDGLMAVFFFVVGLEIKKQVMEGELSTLKKAALPIFAAIGGMLVPAIIFYTFNFGTEADKAWGIPMATDIAFAIGLISLLGTAVSDKLKIFLTALATVDDLGAIVVIALFLTPFIDVQSLIAGSIYFGIMMLANYLGVRNIWFYIIVGILGLWIALLLSGIHATLAGVLGALAIPAQRKITEQKYQENLSKWAKDFNETCINPKSLLTQRQEDIISQIIQESKRAGTPLQRIERKLSPIVGFVILPIFALANAGVRIQGDVFQMIRHPVSMGIIFGLLIGKVLGISTLSFLTVKFRIGRLPEGSNWNRILGVSLFAGIGFTMSLFIAELALDDKELLGIAKVGILTASVIATTLGILWFKIFNKVTSKNTL